MVSDSVLQVLFPTTQPWASDSQAQTFTPPSAHSSGEILPSASWVSGRAHSSLTGAIEAGFRTWRGLAATAVSGSDVADAGKAAEGVVEELVEVDGEADELERAAHPVVAAPSTASNARTARRRLIRRPAIVVPSPSSARVLGSRPVTLQVNGYYGGGVSPGTAGNALPAPRTKQRPTRPVSPALARGTHATLARQSPSVLMVSENLADIGTRT